MKKLKYRIWDPVISKFINQDNFIIDGFGIKSYYRYSFENSEQHSEKCILSQFTGLYDRNVKEICEGDIVKWGHKKGGEEKPVRIAIVKVQPDIQFHIINYKMDFAGQNRIFNYGSFIYKDTHNWLEIIGNIFENPNLNQ